MGRYAKRTLVALSVSSLCFFATHLWYINGKQNSHNNSNKEAIATLVDHVNEVQRKPLARVIWESLTSGETLYAGEAIRTTNVSEAKIIFLKTNTVIELEPDSLVVLEENENGIALDFLQGNLMVKGGTPGEKSNITLKSGKNEIDLNNASLSLSKNKGGDVDLQVFKGSAQLTQDGQTLNVDNSKSGTLSEDGLKQNENQIKVLFPLAGEPVYIDPRKKESVIFQWEKLPPGYRVYIEWGTSRTNLSKYRKRFAQGESGQLKVRTKVGKLYWRLVAEPENESLTPMTSVTLPSEILPKSPPVLLEPSQKSTVATVLGNSKVNFKWANPANLQSLILEYANDSSLTTGLVRKEIGSTLNFITLPIDQNGQFFWRMTGYMKIKDQMVPVSSDISQFTLQVGVDLIPPELRSPLSRQRLTHNQVNVSGLFLSWDPVPGIEDYEVHIQQMTKNSKTNSWEEKGEPTMLTTRTSPLKVASIDSGIYRWHVYSLNTKGEKSKASPKRPFVIEKIPKVFWSKGPGPEQHYYYTAQPNLVASWKNSANENIVAWRYRYAKQGELSEQVPWKKTFETAFTGSVPTKGVYSVEVEALNKAGVPIARSTVKDIEISEKPLLPGPAYADNTPDILKASNRGHINISWDSVEAAKEYQLKIIDSSGSIIYDKPVQRNTASVNKLKPGKYKVTIKTKDQHDRLGPASEERSLEVPNKSNIEAPKLNFIKVK